MAWYDLDNLNWKEKEALPILSPWPPDLKPGAGVYRLVALDGSDGRVRIPRVCGEDRSGTLYIGAANSLEGRVCGLRATLRPQDYKSSSHQAGLLLLRGTRMHSAFPTEILATIWALAEDPRGTERELIAAYVREFGEGPPLNRQWANSRPRLGIRTSLSSWTKVGGEISRRPQVKRSGEAAPRPAAPCH